MAKLHAAEQEDNISAWEKQYPGYRSYRSGDPEEVFDKNADMKPRVDIPDPMLATVLNLDGRIQIADTVYQLGYEGKTSMLYAIPEQYERELLKGDEPGRIKGAKAHKIGLTLMPFFPKWVDNERAVLPSPVSEICNFPSQVLFPWWGQKGDYLYNANDGTELQRDNGRNIRIDYHRWRVGFIFYSSAGVRVKIQKNTRFGGWMSTVKMNQVSLRACSKGIVLVPGLLPVPYHAQVSASGTNTNNLERTVKWVAAPLHVEVLPEHFNFSFSVNYRGQQISRSIIE
jgi:hypothetical protein